MSEATRPFNIMAKPVCGVCNLDCRYCYYTMKPGELYPGVAPGEFRMSEELLENFTRQYLQAQPQHVDVGWQGGEPTMIGLDFFRRAVDLQKQYALPDQEIANALQTNGTLIDEEWAAFLAEHKFLVGISLDGPAQWHDAYRVDHAGDPSYHRAWRGLELLAKHGVEYNVLVTLNSVNAPHAGDLYRYFVNRGVRYLQFIPILERLPGTDDPTDFSCSGEQFGRFMLEVFELWATRDVGRVSERFIDSVLHTLIFGNAAMCCYADRCANAHVLEWNGDLYACDHFVYPEWKLGNINETPLIELVQHPRLEEFACLKTQLPSACGDCEFLPFCKGGCPKHHRPVGTDPQRVNHFCEGYRMFFREALPELRRMAEYFKDNRMPPLKQPSADPAAPKARAARQQAFADGPNPQAAMPGKMQMQRGAAPAAAPGRNDPCPCGSGRKFKKCCGR
ncbi:MAG: anaerobic sulfatase maturase [Phycisphaerae bacterium]